MLSFLRFSPKFCHLCHGDNRNIYNVFLRNICSAFKIFSTISSSMQCHGIEGNINFLCDI